MEELKSKVRELCEMKDELVCAAKAQFSQGVQSVPTHEMGAVIDMIKDLCEAEKDLYKAHYYKKMCEDLHEEEEEMERMGYRGSRMGYDNWRYSSGRFAPTGRGHYDRSGYRPGEMVDPWMMAEGFGENPWHDMDGAHHDGGSMSSSDHSQNGSRAAQNSYGRMGYSGSERGHRYDRYSKARMGYHQSPDASSKEHMDASAREYVVDIAESVKEIWNDADPAMRKEIKNKFVALTSEMN